jgi:hypothetical protein
MTRDNPQHLETVKILRALIDTFALGNQIAQIEHGYQSCEREVSLESDSTTKHRLQKKIQKAVWH